MNPPETLKEYALYYASLGLAVIPVPRGKKGPIIKNWAEAATSDPEQIERWWKQWPDDNIGMVTGPKSGGVFVIDLDVDKDKGADGIQILRAWESENAPLPDTWQDISGRGGTHLYYHSDLLIKNDDRKLHEDTEIRGHGLNVILPPSLHASGRRYEWDIAPWEQDIAEADEIVLKFAGMSEHGKGKPETSERFTLPDTIGEGLRNRTLFQAACFMQGAGFPDSAIEAALEAVNRDLCSPPVSDRELNTLLKSALKYDKGRRFNTWLEAGRLQEMEILERLKNQLIKQSQ